MSFEEVAKKCHYFHEEMLFVLRRFSTVIKHLQRKLHALLIIRLLGDLKLREAIGEEIDWVGIAATLVESSQVCGARNQDVAATTSPGWPGAPGNFDLHSSITSPE